MKLNVLLINELDKKIQQSENLIEAMIKIWNDDKWENDEVIYGIAHIGMMIANKIEEDTD